MSCSDLISFYATKYSDSLSCSGPKEFPTTFIEFLDISMRMDDDWTRQIACVFLGNKKVAVTDYYKYEDPEGIESYYSQVPRDTQMREAALRCGVQRLEAKDGTEYWFHQRYRRNAELLLNILQGTEQPPQELHEIVRSLLLGYTETSIIMYTMYHERFVSLAMAIHNNKGQDLVKLLGDQLPGWELHYSYLIPEFIQRYTPMIKLAKQWIIERGGDVN